MRFEDKNSLRIKKNAFTLAEVLITLGIIGVVAAMTIPNLMTKYKAIRLRSQFLETYSIIQQAYKRMIDDDISLNPKDYKTRTFYTVFMNYFKGATDCTLRGGVAGCYDESIEIYKTIDGKKFFSKYFFDDGQILLNNGTLLIFENPAPNPDNYVWIFADLNGVKNPPNRLGYDLFAFEMLDNSISAMGAFRTKYTDMEKYCNPASTSSMNGIACTQKAVVDSDYFKTLVKKVK